MFGAVTIIVYIRVFDTYRASKVSSGKILSFPDSHFASCTEYASENLHVTNFRTAGLRCEF